VIPPIIEGANKATSHLPIGTRVIYPEAAAQGVPNDVDAAIRYAINHPLNMDPLYALLTPGMKVTIALDDISLPLPPMKAARRARRVLEIVLELLADSGVDDVAPHHRQRAAPAHDRGRDEAHGRREDLRRVSTPTVTVQPRRRATPTASSSSAHGAINEVVEINRPGRRERPHHLREHQPRADGRRAQVGGHGAVGTTKTLRHHHNPKTIRAPSRTWSPKRSICSAKLERIGRVIDKKIKVFHIETTVNNRMFDSRWSSSVKNEDDFTEFEERGLKRS
jgi:hypothetical protein